MLDVRAWPPVHADSHISAIIIAIFPRLVLVLILCYYVLPLPSCPRHPYPTPCAFLPRDSIPSPRAEVSSDGASLHPVNHFLLLKAQF